MTKKTFVISGMHCTSCAISIDGELEDAEGVKEACTNYVASKTEVVFDEKKIQEKKITSIIEGLGYMVAKQK